MQDIVSDSNAPCCRMPRHKLGRTALLLAVIAVGVLVLAIPQYALLDFIALAFELDITLLIALVALVVLGAIAAVGIAYGIGLESSTGRPGKSEILYRQRRAGNGRRRQ